MPSKESVVPESKIIAGWRFGVFATFRELVGHEKASQILGKFNTQLKTCFAFTTDKDSIRVDAHKVVSTAGLLGFERLSERARSLQIVCSLDHPFEELLAIVLLERERVDVAIAAYGEGGDAAIRCHLD
jgi:HPt (histidine-containing phosphotransfer) domain-containing protein